MNEWGCEFFGEAHTISGDFWWYEDDGKRYPLLPLEGVIASVGHTIQKRTP